MSAKAFAKYIIDHARGGQICIADIPDLYVDYTMEKEKEQPVCKTDHSKGEKKTV